MWVVNVFIMEVLLYLARAAVDDAGGLVDVLFGLREIPTVDGNFGTRNTWCLGEHGDGQNQGSKECCCSHKIGYMPQR